MGVPTRVCVTEFFPLFTLAEEYCKVNNCSSSTKVVLAVTVFGSSSKMNVTMAHMATSPCVPCFGPSYVNVTMAHLGTATSPSIARFDPPSYIFGDSKKVPSSCSSGRSSKLLGQTYGLQLESGSMPTVCSVPSQYVLRGATIYKMHVPLLRGQGHEYDGNKPRYLKFKNFASAGTTPLESEEHIFSSDLEEGPDPPSLGFSSVTEALKAIKQGKFVVVVNDQNREPSGDLVMAASLATPEAMAFMVDNCTGTICVGMKGRDLGRLNLPLFIQVPDKDEAMAAAFSVTVDAPDGTTTKTAAAVSACDRAQTVLALASRSSKSDRFKRPGHIFPLRALEGGVLTKPGRTEAAVDLPQMSGLPAVGAFCELANTANGSMSRLCEFRKFAKTNKLPIISIADLVSFRRNEGRNRGKMQLVERTAVARLPTQWGNFQIYSYKALSDGIEHVAMVKGDIGDGLDVLVRVHSECFTGDIFGSARCDCGNQLAQAMKTIEKEGRGVVIYLRGHEGRGIGLGNKLLAYNLQDAGRDTVEANVDLGLPVDCREYGAGAQMLKDLGVRTITLMTNNPSKSMGLKGHGLAVTQRVPILSPVTKENERYLAAKRSKMGHVYGFTNAGSGADFMSPQSDGPVKTATDV